MLEILIADNIIDPPAILMYFLHHLKFELSLYLLQLWGQVFAPSLLTLVWEGLSSGQKADEDVNDVSHVHSMNLCKLVAYVLH